MENQPKTSRQALHATSNYRWIICGMLFLATTINYMDRQVLSLTWKDFIAPEFHWSDSNYGDVAGIFALVYAVANLFAGRIIDWLGTRRGYLWAIGIWSGGACLHALCGWATRHYLGIESTAELVGATGAVASTVAMVSVWFFMAARIVLAVGEAGNFPSAVKVTAEYFTKKDRAFATAIFNSGSTIGALVAPLCIPVLARYFKNIGVGNGWEMAFIIIGALGFLWMGVWMFVYKAPHQHPSLPPTPPQGSEAQTNSAVASPPPLEGVGSRLFLSRKTWAIILGKFLTDGVWWFFLFWTPAYISDVYGYTSDTPQAQMLIFTLYAITLLSIYGGKLPTIFINRTGGDAYTCRMRAMFIFALFPLLGLLAQPLGGISPWLTIVMIGIVGAAHQSWSANLFTVGSDLFPPQTVATITGINGMAGGLSSFLINVVSGRLIDYAHATQLHVLGFEGKEAAYFLIFCYCSVAYLLGWTVMKLLVPHGK